MTTHTAGPPDTAAPPDSAGPAAPEGSGTAAQRGRLQIPERVVQRIAEQAASEVSAAGGRSGGFLGIGSRSDPEARPRVRVSLSRESVDLDIALAVGYPTSIRAATAEVRDHVTRRVQQMTGIPVHRIDIDVTATTTRTAHEGGLR